MPSERKPRPQEFVIGLPFEYEPVYGAEHSGPVNPRSLELVRDVLRSMYRPGFIAYELVPRPDLGESDGNGGVRKPGK